MEKSNQRGQIFKQMHVMKAKTILV